MSFELNPGQSRAMSELLTSGARFCLMYGGSRSGKTALSISCIIDRALISPNSRHLIVRRTAGAAVRAIVGDTFPKVWSLKFPDIPVPHFNGQLGRYTLPNNSEIWIGGLNDEKAVERILGNEYATIYINEASEVPLSSFTLLRSRLAQVCTKINGKQLAQKFYLDLNPTTVQHWTYKLFVLNEDPETGEPVRDHERYGFSQINPTDNIENLGEEYLHDLKTLSPRARKRFFDGVFGSDDDGALWKRDWIKRVDEIPDLVRVVIAVDPALSSEQGSDETGIIAVGMTADKEGYVLADESGRYEAQEWAERAVALYQLYNADVVVAETNVGGNMVESMMRAINPLINYDAKWAKDSKVKRAEPIAALYHLGKVYHVGEFPVLEDQMCAFTVDFDRKKQGYSPDRVDALVWGLANLFQNLTDARKKNTTRPKAPDFSMV